MIAGKLNIVRAKWLVWHLILVDAQLNTNYFYYKIQLRGQLFRVRFSNNCPQAPCIP